jgi:hypothetical protein
VQLEGHDNTAITATTVIRHGEDTGFSVSSGKVVLPAMGGSTERASTTPLQPNS